MDRARRLVAGFSVLLLLGLLGLGGRLVWIATERHDWAQQASARQSLREETLPARRGRILDRWGRVLAESVRTLRLEVLPRNVLSRAEDGVQAGALVQRIAEFLSPRLGVPVAELTARLTGERWCRLGPAITDPVAIDEIVAEQRDLLRGIDLVEGWARSNPWGAVAGNLVGYVDHEDRGVAGLEQGLHELLAGRDGLRQVRVDPLGREVDGPGLSSRAPEPGVDVHLTLDVRAQQIVEEELHVARAAFEATRATAVLLDTAGDVLVLASVPGVDLADPTQRGGEGAVLGAVQEVYAPGSTFKPLMMAAALKLGLADPAGQPIACDKFEGRAIRDTHPQTHRLTLEEIIVHSSNIGMAKILTRIVPEDDPKNTALMAPVHQVLLDLGLGRPTGVPLPAEVPGTVTPLSRWHRKYTLASVAFGQELGVSALQMAAAASTLHDGLHRNPRLVAGLGRPDGTHVPVGADPPEPVFSRLDVERVRTWMARAVAEGACPALNDLPVRVAGKTGTADLETKLAEGAEVHSYLALVPAEDPVFTLLVVLREPQGIRYAASSAAPTAAAILARLLPYFGVAPQD